MTVGDQVVNKEWDITFTIEGVEEYDFRGATREVVFANITVDSVFLEYNWDRETGIIIQIYQTADTFTQEYLACDTNIVGNAIPDPYSPLIYGIIIAVVVVLLLSAMIIFRRRE